MSSEMRIFVWRIQIKNTHETNHFAVVGAVGIGHGPGDRAATLGTQNYARLRFGIGNDFPKGGQIDFVLGHFDEESMKQMPERLEVAQEIIKSFCLAGLNITMNQYNNK